jgi:hypothetical protein
LVGTTSGFASIDALKPRAYRDQTPEKIAKTSSVGEAGLGMPSTETKVQAASTSQRVGNEGLKADDIENGDEPPK